MNDLEREALKFAWQVLEDERLAAAEAMQKAADPQKAAAQYVGYLDAMNTLARKSNRLELKSP